MHVHAWSIRLYSSCVGPVGEEWHSHASISIFFNVFFQICKPLPAGGSHFEV